MDMRWIAGYHMISKCYFLKKLEFYKTTNMKNYHFPQIYAKNKFRISYEEILSLFSFLEFSELFFRIISNLLTKRLELAIVGKIQILLIGLIYKKIQGPRNDFFIEGG